jgi:hypothetical protein
MPDGSIPPNAEIAPGTIITGFDYCLPASPSEVEAQVMSALARNRPEVLRRQSLTVIANGPSAREFEPGCGETLALNGAFDLFFNSGRVPTYWAACDSQALVADFLPDQPPLDTTYLIASRCHPAVFDKLKNRDVRVWHSKEFPLPGKRAIPRNCSITLNALWLMFSLGYMDFDVWGWDACFGEDGEAHAGMQAKDPPPRIEINYGGTLTRTPVRQTLLERLQRKPKEEILNMEGGRFFPTTRTWAAEVKGAEQFFHLAEYFGMTVNVRGDGLIKAAQAQVLIERAAMPENL